MIYLGLALYAEGPTDYLFLGPLLQRVAEELALDARGTVDVSEVLPLNEPPEFRDRPRDQRILKAAELAVSQWRILFVHADGAANPVKARVEQVEPALEAVEARMLSGKVCAVVPVRETEAWALCDPEAFRGSKARAAAVARYRDQTGDSPESDRDPKKSLRDILNSGLKPSARRGKTERDVTLRDLGERVDLERLRGLPSFERFEEEFRQALLALGVLRER